VSELAGRVAVVTGAARGIGAAAAVALAEAGADVTLLDVLDCAATAAAVEAAGRRALPLAADMSGRASVAGAIASVRDRFGRIDALVAAAGVMPPRSDDPDQWDRVIAVNLTGVASLLRAAAPVMEAGGGGAAVLVSSVAAYAGATLAGPEYTASKAGLIGLARDAARNLGPRGIRCNVVAPGVIETDMNAGLPKPDPATLPLRRLGTPADVAGPIRFLCGPAAGYVTGTVLHVNGGQHFGA